MNLLPQEPSSIAKVLDSSFKLYKASFSKIIAFAIIIGLINVAAGLSANLVEVDENNFTGMPENMGAFFAAMLVIMLISFMVFGALIYQIDKIANQQDCSIGEAFAVGLRKFPTILLAVILYGLAITVGSLLLIIPGIILSLSLFFYYYFIILEAESAYQSLKSSHKLVWKDWWRTLGVFTVPGILFMILIVGFGIAIGFMEASGSDSGWVEFLMNAFSGIYLPYFYTLGYVQYHDLKLRKSGGDLEARMAG